jgi:hypothetical protein
MLLPCFPPGSRRSLLFRLHGALEKGGVQGTGQDERARKEGGGREWEGQRYLMGCSAAKFT